MTTKNNRGTVRVAFREASTINFKSDMKFWFGTLEEYNALTELDTNTSYFIEEEDSHVT